MGKPLDLVIYKMGKASDPTLLPFMQEGLSGPQQCLALIELGLRIIKHEYILPLSLIRSPVLPDAVGKPVNRICRKG
ncbi:MAG: hypothetical protein EOM68_24485 [Spirochaetia bacterium]|nr:hypothetical protein [Spirochaetia bacterium]